MKTLPLLFIDLVYDLSANDWRGDLKVAQASSMTTMTPPLFSVAHTCGGNQPAKQLSSIVTWSCGCAVDRGTQTEEKKVMEKALDLVFLMDTTGSWGKPGQISIRSWENSLRLQDIHSG